MNNDTSARPDASEARFGTWASPITSDLIVAGTIGLGGLTVLGEQLYWLESRPTEGGRTTLMCRPAGGDIVELTPAPANVRSRVHEYGGGAYAAAADGRVCYVDFADQRVHLIEPGKAVRPLTVAAALRFADLDFDLPRGRVYAIREDHRRAGEPSNALVALALDGSDQDGAVIAEGHDFFAYPTLSPDGRHLAWITWDHPNMPWDGSELWLAEVDEDGVIGTAHRIAGGAAESVLQPEWASDGSLFFISDRSGWSNLYCWRDGRVEPVCPTEAEFGFPLWQLGMRSYRVLAPNRLVATMVRDGLPSLQLVVDGTLVPFESGFAEASVPYRYEDGWALIGATTRRQSRLALLAMDGREIDVVRAASETLIDPDYISVAMPVEFPTEDGRTAHAFFYAPANRDYRAPVGELPPLIVRSHGGPTAAAGSGLSLAIQYWTSRGFAVVDVNYGGSTGFGRAYRQRLDNRWGVVDVLDCIAAARHLVEADLVDADRLAIRGGSAGGFTTLAALTFHDVFQAGASHYGIGDLMALARDTHKFESRYLDRLVGPLPAAEPVYRERSPIHFTDQLNCPVIFFQGLDDKVVPPNQAEAMVAALRAKGLPVAYVPFEGEGHGFRRAENIKRALEGELFFYGRIFGFEPAGDIDPVEIENL
ncbi:MAG: prolyl oligopeptidase family serine peptidase [Alphaproteobacteria bacterium]